MTALDDAWQAALAAEHQAAFGYALLGPQLTGTDLDLAIACSNAHEAVRNQTEAAMTAAGVIPVQPLPDYPRLYPVPDATAARRLAVRLEDACARAWRALFFAAVAGHGTTARTLRGTAQQTLTASAVRGTRWRSAAGLTPTVAFPGT